MGEPVALDFGSLAPQAVLAGLDHDTQDQPACRDEWGAIISEVHPELARAPGRSAISPCPPGGHCHCVLAEQSAARPQAHLAPSYVKLSDPSGLSRWHRACEVVTA